jgi:hypothetical protein
MGGIQLSSKEEEKIPRVTKRDNVLKMMMMLKTGQSVTLLDLDALEIWAWFANSKFRYI